MSEVPHSKHQFHEGAILAWMHDFAPYGVITTDKEFNIQSWNRWMTNHSGKPSEEVLNQHLFKLFPDLKERGLAPRFERALVGEVSLLSTALHGYLLPMASPVREGAFQHMQQTARIAPLLFENETAGTIIVIEDVTQRELQALLLQRQHDRARILSWALAHLLESREPRRTMRELFCKIAEQSDFDGYLLYLLTPSQTSLKLQAAGGILPEVEERISLLEISSELGRILLESAEPRSCEDLTGPESRAPLLGRQFGFQVCVLLPLKTPESLTGVLCFGARNRAKLEDGELDLLSTIGKYLAVALHKEATNLELHAAQAKLNQHAQHLEVQVSERTAKLRDIIAELETFSYTLAHDLRAPIRALIGYSEILLEEYSAMLPGEGNAIIDRIHRACKQLDDLTRDLLEFSKVSRQDIQLGPVDLEEIMTDVISLLSASKGKVVVRRPLHRVLAHRGLLQQCVANLLDNALKFVKENEPASVSVWTERSGEEKGTSVTARAEPFSPVRMSAPSPGVEISEGTPGRQLATSRVRLVVQDSGIGIPYEAHSKIFGIFERGTSSPKYPGSGIGLAIVARAIQRMGGSYGVESTPGVGSRFWLELPEH
jgi:signal transduction histidine kinase